MATNVLCARLVAALLRAQIDVDGDDQERQDHGLEQNSKHSLPSEDSNVNLEAAGQRSDASF